MGTSRATDVPGDAFVIDNRTPWDQKEADGDEAAGQEPIGLPSET